MSNDRYTLHHGLFTTLGILLIVGATFRSCMPKTSATNYTQPSQSLPQQTQQPTEVPAAPRPRPKPQVAQELADPIPSALPAPLPAPLRCLDPEIKGDFQLQACECKHDNQNFIQCVWFIKNINSRDPIRFWVSDAHVTDNESRENINVPTTWSTDGGFGFCQNGNSADLIYDDWTRFCVRFRDSNPDLKTINARIDFQTGNGLNHFPYEFREIPVRQSP
jgi:hypothetical protein